MHSPLSINSDLARLQASVPHKFRNFISYREGLYRDGKRNGTIEAVLNNQGYETVVSDFGAHSRSFRVPTGKKLTDNYEVFYLSPSSNDPESATRGGVPLVLCQNGLGDGSPTALPMHGFPRINFWKFTGQGLDPNFGPFVELTLNVRARLAELTGVNKPDWNDFKFIAKIAVGPGGHYTRLEVRNRGVIDQKCDVVLHSYVATSDFTKVQTRGLKGYGFRDLTGGPNPNVIINNEKITSYPDRNHVQHLYERVPDGLEFLDAADDLFRCFRMKTSGFPNFKMWNGGDTPESVNFTDLPDQDRLNYFCPEAVALGIIIPAGKSKIFTQQLVYREVDRI